ncbi:hypothetical protein [Mycolicibacterium fortuitum]|uniref:hypothetical protein n=1 Tax=Mycolicibacterium fortuitum TaxID=1766 RepID=UPI003AAD935D
MGNDTIAAGSASVYTKAQAKEHDAKLADATKALHAAAARVDQAANDIHQAAGDMTRYVGRSRRWTMTFDDAVAAAQTVAAGSVEILGPLPAGSLERAPRRAAAALQAHEAAMQAVIAARQVIEELEEVWRTHGQWNRFFMVPGGHIHSSTGCHSLRITTRISWLPQLSGESEAEAVGAYGTVLCTKCFASAPVEWTTQGPEPVDPKLCPGSKKYVRDADMRLYSPRGTCPECGQWISVTKSGLARKHDRPKGATPEQSSVS